MKLSIIILNYKVPYYLLLCLQSVEKAVQQLDAEIIVVDNCSSDESCDLVKKHFPQVILVQNDKNEGFSKGNNRGVKMARGKYICLLNPDTAVAETTFENTLKFAENHPDLGAIGVKMIDGTGNFLPESKRNLPTPKVAFQKLIGKSNKYYAEHLAANQNGKVEILAGAFMLMKKSRYLEVGGLDEDYFMYGEDIDLSYKFSVSGYQNYFVGTETILHYKGESTVKDNEYANRFYGAMRLFYQKHFQRNPRMDFLVKYGLEAAKLSNKWRSSKKSVFSKPTSILLISTNKEDLLAEMEQLFQTKTEQLSPENWRDRTIKNALFVLDAQRVSFETIFQLMEQYKNSENSFRIKPANHHFLIGSDSSDNKGEVRFF